MGLFSRKKKIDAAEFARDFYDTSVFGAEVCGVDVVSVFADTWKKIICTVDASFEDVSTEKFKEELLPLRLETIGIAWGHKSKREVSVEISKFTKKYLADIDRSDLWEAMLVYNKLVAHAPISYAEAEKVPKDEVQNLSKFLNYSRYQFMDSLELDDNDGQAVARVVNRFGSEPPWKAGFSQPFLASRLTERLGLEFSIPIIQHLGEVVDGFYRGAEEALEGVKLTV